jgi:hypothetical protein
MNLIETSQLIKVVGDNPILTFLLIIVPIYLVIRAMLVAWTRFLRHLNIRAQGWPPPHLDADGDAVETTTEEEQP